MSRGEGRNLGYIRADQEDSTVKSLENSRREEVDEWNARRLIQLISIGVSFEVHWKDFEKLIETSGVSSSIEKNCFI